MKPTKINGKVFFSADFHFSHALMIDKRGLGTKEEHNATILKSINDTVDKSDHLIFAGDFSLNSTVEETRELFKQINCNNVWKLWGNHVSYTCKIYREELDMEMGTLLENNLAKPEVYPFRMGNVIFCGYEREFIINKKNYVVSHFPLQIWNKSHHGARHVHGHCHGSFKDSLPDAPKMRRLDVGWDIFKKPVSFEEVEEIMSGKEVVILDHHCKETT